MRRITLIKTSNVVNVAHLYEHIYCMALVRLFREHNLFAYTDYHYAARTYGAGIIHLDIWLFTADARELELSLAGLNPTFDEPAVTAATIQLIAEKQAEVRGDLSLIIDLLNELHTQTWETIDEFGLLDSNAVRRSQKGLRFVETSKTRFRQMRCEIQLDRHFAQKHRDMLPLFHVVADALLANLTEDLGDSYYYYSYKTASSYTKQAVVEARRFRTHAGQNAMLTSEVDACHSLIARMLAHGFIRKLAHGLHHVSYGASMLAPDEFEVFEASEIFVGGSGWRATGTEENITDVLQHSTISLVFGRINQGFSISGVMSSDTSRAA